MNNSSEHPGGNSLVTPVAGTQCFHRGGTSSIPGQGTNIPQALHEIIRQTISEKNRTSVVEGKEAGDQEAWPQCSSIHRRAIYSTTGKPLAPFTHEKITK